jgi:hypothetical protein
MPELRFIRLRLPEGRDIGTITCPTMTLACIPHGVTLKGIAVEVVDEEQFVEIVEKLREIFPIEPDAEDQG